MGRMSKMSRRKNSRMEKRTYCTIGYGFIIGKEVVTYPNKF